MMEVEKQEQKRKEQQEEIRFRREIKNVKRPRPVKQIERERGRELAGLRKLGRML
jgi:hypothetical protein